MIKFSEIVASATPNCYKFVNQRTVKVIGLFVPGVSDYILSKADVILAIKEYIKCIHSFSDKPIRGEGMNFNAFKMHDLVPYLYTLINLFVSVGATSYSYHRFLPELKLTRFCHLPFEDEVIVPAKEDKVINVFSAKDLDGTVLFCCAMFGNVLSSVSLDGLKGIVLYQYRNLANRYNLVFKVAPFMRG